MSTSPRCGQTLTATIGSAGSDLVGSFADQQLGCPAVVAVVAWRKQATQLVVEARRTGLVASRALGCALVDMLLPVHAAILGDQAPLHERLSVTVE